MEHIMGLYETPFNSIKTDNEMVEQTYRIYTPEQEKQRGTVTLRIKLLESS